MEVWNQRETTYSVYVNLGKNLSEFGLFGFG